MNLIVCLDDKNGMLFNGRRQSRDRVVCDKMISLTENGMLWMNTYSAKLFSDHLSKICVDDDFLLKAKKEDYCFVENSDISVCADKLARIVVFRWNALYPADTYLPNELLASGWSLSVTESFPGFSHEKITMEIYKK